MIKIKKFKPLFLILLLSLIIRLVFLFMDYPPWWDSHVYIGIGKYLFSGGELGVWESFRPLIHPLILGTVWKIGLNPIVWGKITDIIFSLLAIGLVYKISKQLFNEKVAWLSSLIFSLTPAFIIFTGLMLADPLAIVFGLIGLLFLIRKKIFWSGFFLGLSFLTKFPQGIWFGAVFLVFLFQKELKNNFFLTLGFLLPVIPFLIFNYNLYGNPFEPFLTGTLIVTTATWLYGSGLFHYFIHFFLKNPLYLLFLAYLCSFLKNKEWKNESSKMTLILICILTITYFIYVPRKEVRYLATIIPLMTIFVSVKLNEWYGRLKQKEKPIVNPQALIVLTIILLLLPIPAQLNIERTPTFEKEAARIVRENKLSGIILSTDPSFISYFDWKVVTFDGLEFAAEIYDRNRDKYGLIFINSCDLICAEKDENCQEKRESFLNQIQKENKEVFEDSFTFKKTGRQCFYWIYIQK